jgi:hypothetical protein
MKISKQQRKELRELYEQKCGEEYVRWIREQPVYRPFEWVDTRSIN